MSEREFRRSASGLVEGVREALEPAGASHPAEALLRAVADAVREVARSRDVEVRVEPPSGLPPLQVDADRLLRALAHLAEMALARLSPGELLVLRAVPTPGSRSIRFSVSEAFYLETPVDPQPVRESGERVPRRP